MLDETSGHGMINPMKQLKGLGRHSRLLECGTDHFGEGLTGAGVVGVGLDDHRTTHRHGGSGIRADHGNGEGEIASSDYDHRPDRQVDRSHSRLRQGRAVGLRFFNPRLLPFPRIGQGGEGPEFGDGPGQLKAKSIRPQ